MQGAHSTVQAPFFPHPLVYMEGWTLESVHESADQSCWRTSM